MAHRIEVGLKKGMRDPLGERMKKRIQNDLGLSIKSVRTISVFTLDVDLSREELEAVASGPFLDLIIQEYSIDGSLAQDFDWLVEVGFRPGVTDNVGKTAREAIQWRLGKQLEENERVYTSIQYLLRGVLKREAVERICTDLLANPLIHRFDIRSRKDWSGKIEPSVPRVIGIGGAKVEQIDSWAA